MPAPPPLPSKSLLPPLNLKCLPIPRVADAKRDICDVGAMETREVDEEEVSLNAELLLSSSIQAAVSIKEGDAE